MKTYHCDLLGLRFQVRGVYIAGYPPKEDEPGSEPSFEIHAVYLRNINMTEFLENFYARNGRKLLNDMEEELAHAIEHRTLAG
jgi:hypothetical protein